MLFNIPFIRKIHNDLTMESKIDEIPMSRYPRPQLKRDSYLCLNGKWDNGVTVPYPLESHNSGHKGRVNKFNVYTRSFEVPADFVIKDKVLLNFGAVDQTCEVFVNDKPVGDHAGGYLPFSLDITEALNKGPGVTNTLKVAVTDTLSHFYAYGKQKKHSGGMWYTPVSGIWQTVWLESVSDDYIKTLEIVPSLTGIDVNIDSEANDYEIEIYDGDRLIHSERTAYDLIHIDIKDPVLWTPDNPKLYTIKIRTKHDEVSSYFGLRTVRIEEVDGIKRILLNDKPFFFHAILDQGYFPEGIYTPNTEKDYEEDILRIKELGFNTIRKHIKIEPQCFYEACDRLGMLVFQDVVNSGSYRYIKNTALPTFGFQSLDDTKARVSDSQKNEFALNMEDTITYLYSFPCIVYFTIFNEGWGQFESDMLYDWAKTIEKTRVIDSTSGWFWQQKNDVDSYHIYFWQKPTPYNGRPIVFSEFGGMSYKVKEHSYSKYASYGYTSCKSGEELTDAIIALYERDIIPRIKDGVCGSVYTQAFDVEEETNGLYTYDRKVCKVNKEKLVKMAEKLKIPQ